jgi:hypothetical protein
MPTLDQSRKRAKEDRLQAHTKAAGLAYVVYNIERGTSYPVVKRGNMWTCSCAWMTHKSTVGDGMCKHIVRVLDKMRAEGVE